jgi:hypothetical protein
MCTPCNQLKEIIATDDNQMNTDENAMMIPPEFICVNLPFHLWLKMN